MLPSPHELHCVRQSVCLSVPHGLYINSRVPTTACTAPISSFRSERIINWAWTPLRDLTASAADQRFVRRIPRELFSARLMQLHAIPVRKSLPAPRDSDFSFSTFAQRLKKVTNTIRRCCGVLAMVAPSTRTYLLFILMSTRDKVMHKTKSVSTDYVNETAVLQLRICMQSLWLWICSRSFTVTESQNKNK